SLSNLCIVDWLLGQVSEAVVHGRAALELAGQLRHAHTLGYAFAHVCMLHTLERDVQMVETLGQRALVGALKRELPLWISVARTFLGWCEIESGRLEAGIEALEKQRSFLQTAQLVYWLPTYLCWLTDAYTRVAKVHEAKLCLEQTRDVIGRGGNSWYEAECLRLEGRLVARAEIHDHVQAEWYFERALALAHQRGQRGFALRAARDLAGHLAEKGQPARARALLQNELEFFADQPGAAIAQMPKPCWAAFRTLKADRRVRPARRGCCCTGFAGLGARDDAKKSLVGELRRWQPGGRAVPL